MNQNQAKILTDSFIEGLMESKDVIEFSGFYGSEKAYFISRLYDKIDKNIVVMVPNSKYAEIVSDDLYFFDNGHNVTGFPVYNITPFKTLSYVNEITALRIGILYNMINNRNRFLAVVPIEALRQRVIPKKELIGFAELVLPGEDIDREVLIEKLIAGGYSRTLIVEEPGDYCIRGEIMDIFSPQYQNPIRILFFGETVESIKFFSPLTQRTSNEMEEAIILPGSETVIGKDRLDFILERIESRMKTQNFSPREIDSAVKKVKDEKNFSEIAKLLPIVYDDTDILYDYLGDNTIFINYDDRMSKEVSSDLESRIYKDYREALDEKRLCLEPGELYIDWERCREEAKKRKLISFDGMPLYSADKGSNNFYFGEIEDNSLISGTLRNFYEKDDLLKPLAEWIIEKRRWNCAVFLVCSTDIQANRIKSLMAPYGIGFGFIEKFSYDALNREEPFICKGELSSGFFWRSEGLALITEDEIFGPKKRRKIKKYEVPVKTDFLSFDDLKAGDFVVHIEHGIGRYAGIVKLKLEGVENDFLVIEYKDTDRLYLPVDRLSMLQKYIGIEGIDPAVDKMGGISWDNVKKKLKKSAEKIAKELVKIYAERKVGKGYAFSGQSAYFEDFEASFPYEETPDQIKAIEEVLADMQSETPMDRLICGDIGYGKTEVALRASFFAVNDGKQVAILAPTTLLVNQHYEIFKERFKKYPVTIESLSRLNGLKETRKIIEELKTGRIDIIIGTHKLLGKEIEFKDLRLLIIDEEQRFGVRHKETLKKIRRTIDVLALTATPIPRTLHLSLIGIRDISVMETEPEGRKSIITYISEFDEEIVKEAITREIARDGQVFFVHNEIEKIFSIASFVKRIVPEARVGVGHGRLDKIEIEKVMTRFLSKEIDVLVCTTIIESGLDIASANTIIIDRADRFGLSQIYQLRGRVGRTHRQAFAYLFVPKNANLTKNAQKRLKVLMEHTKLGSGFKIAMHDLQIRGGGTILGVSQSGKIAAVGYEMFLKIMKEAISEIKGEPVSEKLEPEINLNISALIPESYMEDIEQRLAVYKKLSDMIELKELADFKIELEDIYGKLPERTENLFLKIMFKILAIKAAVKRLDISTKEIIIHFSQNHIKSTERLIDMVMNNSKRFQFVGDYILKVKLSRKNSKAGDISFPDIKNILKEIACNVILKS